MNKYRITYPNNKEVREYKSRTTKDRLKEILEGYRDFLKYIISNKKLLH